MLGVLVNAGTVILGTLIGLIFKKGIPEKLINAVMTAVGLCVVFIGISGSLDGKNVLAVIITMALGALIGTLINIDGALNRLGSFIEGKFKKDEKSGVSVGEGMVSATLLFCVGAMTVVGSLNAGISGDNTMLYTKAVLDFVSSMMLTVSLGYGVIFSVFPLIIYQGGIVLLSGLLQPVLNEVAIADLTCVGSLMILAIGLNMIKVTNIKVADLLPGLVLSPFVTYIYTFISGLIA